MSQPEQSQNKEPKTRKKKWTQEKIRETMKQYTCFNTMVKEQQTVYQAARREGEAFLKEVTAHMVKQKRGRKPTKVESQVTELNVSVETTTQEPQTQEKVA